MSHAAMGIDASPNATAAVVAPAGWSGDWTQLSGIVVGERVHDGGPDEERILRIDRIVEKVVGLAVEKKVSIAWIEDYAFGMIYRMAFVGELGGVIRRELWKVGVEVRSMNISKCRKILLGKNPTNNGRKAKGLPKIDAKKIVMETLLAAGAPFDPKDFDTGDAFTVLNAGLSDIGGFCFMQAPP